MLAFKPILLLLGMHLFVTVKAQRHEVAVRESQLRIVLQMLNVMYHSCTTILAMPLASLAFVMVTLQDFFALMSPCRRPIERQPMMRRPCYDIAHPYSSLKLYVGKVIICLHNKSRTLSLRPACEERMHMMTSRSQE